MACRVCQKTYTPATDDDYDSDAKPHVCTTCGQSFSLKIQLKRHTLLHANGEPFTCIHCSKDGDESAVSYNLRLSKKGDYTCDVCNLNFSSKRMLLRHTNDEHTFESSYFCDDCPEIFDSAAELKRHASSTHKSKKRASRAEPDEPLKCPTCNKSFVYQASLDKHVTRCDSDDFSTSPKKRSSTGANSPSKKSKKNFVDVFENTDKKHECSVCGKSFTRKSALDGHLATHANDESDFAEELSESDSESKKSEVKRSFICIKCSFVCFSQLTLAKHVCRKDKKPEEKHQCDRCSKSFDSAEELDRHKPTHSEKSFTCEICEKTFRSEKRLNRHMEFHEVELNSDNEDQESVSAEKPKRRKSGKRKDLSCSYCGKEFQGEKCLKKHVRRHETGEKFRSRRRRKKSKVPETLVCSFCNEEFIGRKSQYIKHMHGHTPEVCGICDERFVDRPSLREHCKVHVGTEEGRMFVECSQKALDAKNGVLAPEPKVEYIYLVLR